MNLKRLSSILILTGGSIELMIGVIHFTWPFSLLRLPDFVNIADSIRDLLVLASLAVGLCLTVFAFLSFYFSWRTKFEDKNTMIFCFSQSILWSIRLIFEILLPVKFSIFFIDNPSNIIVVGAIGIISIYLTTVLFLRIQ